jgi:hypothetical protein
MELEVLHYPRLDTVLMIEEALKNADVAISRNELQRRLPRQVMRQTLNLVLDYLEEKGIIMIGSKGVLCVHNESPQMKMLLEKSTEAHHEKGAKGKIFSGVRGTAKNIA